MSLDIYIYKKKKKENKYMNENAIIIYENNGSSGEILERYFNEHIEGEIKNTGNYELSYNDLKEAVDFCNKFLHKDESVQKYITLFNNVNGLDVCNDFIDEIGNLENESDKYTYYYHL